MCLRLIPYEPELETRVHQIKAILTHQSLQAIYSEATLRLTLPCNRCLHTPKRALASEHKYKAVDC
jgi:hypothetical protein